MGIKIPFPATAEKSDVDTASFAQSFMKQAAFFFGMFVIFLATKVPDQGLNLRPL